MLGIHCFSGGIVRETLAPDHGSRKRRRGCVEVKLDSRVIWKTGRLYRLPGRERIVCMGLVRYRVDSAQRTLRRLPDTSVTLKKRNSFSSDNSKLRVLLATKRPDYLRVGDGNKLVRRLKPPTRILGTQRRWTLQKAKWTLQNARTHRLRKQYCQFFTRFGKCDRGEGKCPYIHDADKIAVCTQFLKGTCRNKDCLLTHKAIPERMPDCLYFLQGLCTNEECPFRHVKVNSNAPVCDQFLRGYCAAGDNCNKQHTFVCTVYSDTGQCPEQASCKLHHPKRKEVPVPKLAGLRRQRRQFGCDSGIVRDSGDSDSSEVDQLFKRLKLFPAPQEFSLEAFLSDMGEGPCELDRLIKPSFLLPPYRSCSKSTGHEVSMGGEVARSG